jgi:hypothetical protein
MRSKKPIFVKGFVSPAPCDNYLMRLGDSTSSERTIQDFVARPKAMGPKLEK